MLTASGVRSRAGNGFRAAFGARGSRTSGEALQVIRVWGTSVGTPRPADALGAGLERPSSGALCAPDGFATPLSASWAEPHPLTVSTVAVSARIPTVRALERIVTPPLWSG
jgi:hypothetical protein